MSKSLAKDFLIYGIGAGLSQSLLLLLVPVYTRVFSPEIYGIIELIQSGFILLSVFGMLQLESAAGRFYYDTDNFKSRQLEVSTIFWVILITSLGLSLVLSFFSLRISKLIFDNSDFSLSILITVLTIPLANLYNYFAVLIRFEKKPIAYSIVTLLQLLTTAGLAIILVVYLNWGISGVFISQFVGFFLGLIGYIYFFRRYLIFQFRNKVLMKYFKFSLPMLPAVLGNWANNHGNRFAMLSLLSLKEIGIYAVSIKIASVFKLGDFAFKMAWGPFYIEKFQDDGHIEIYNQIFRYVVFGVILLVVLFSLFGEEVLQLLTTSEFYESKQLLGIIGLAFGIGIISSVVGVGPILMKQTQYNSYSALLSIVFNFGFLFVLTPVYGLLGVAISFLIGFLVLLLSQWHFTQKLYPINYSIPYFGLFFVLGLTTILLVTIKFNPPLIYRLLLALIILLFSYFIFYKIVLKHKNFFKEL